MMLACLAMAAAAGPMFAAPPAAPKTHPAVIDGTKFQPDSLTIKLGDTVVWTNQDPFPHTVTSAAGRFDSKAIAPGKSWKFKPSKRGEFPYVCSFHPTMSAVLRVE
jgi:plastocyanin